ncbi:glutamate racemase [Thiopseudomonas alkaliphila]|uniref:glutamate racemase n=1 Tax=Thiopseudomonas alkaliphila TaxID=1697053 RepID=UPI00257547AB|nr:glutamate racemase [Thiopseudomonas alkaliphila]MDM1707926.1 glutamate racemase [Thiopseudomonas alkaliphila]
MQAPIGIFDSGVGGLSVLTEVQALLPNERLIYIADSHYLPYGDKPNALVIERSVKLTEYLLAQQAKAVIVACNTATAAAAGYLRECWPELPIIGLEPAVKPAASYSKQGKIGVLATQGTLSSQRFASLLERYAAALEVVSQPCIGLADQIERGLLSTSETRALLERYLQPIQQAGCDALVLGCTHYPFIKPLLEELLDDSIKVFDTGPAIARQLRTVLFQRGLLADQSSTHLPAFYTTGWPAQFEQVLHLLLNIRTAVQPLSLE